MTPRIPPPLPRVSDDDRVVIGRFLSAGPLYGTLTIPGLWLDGDTLDKVLPVEITRDCEACGFETRWRLRSPVVDGAFPGHASAGFLCRNCSAKFEVWFQWRHEYPEEVQRGVESRATVNRLAAAAGATPPGDLEPPPGQFAFEKVGQTPAASVALPPELAKALGKHHGLYRRGMVCRNQGYGIGALGYFRRIVEETMNDMLELLGEALREHGADPVIIGRVEAAKTDRVFEKKARVAADSLPEALRPGGFNPFGSLHDQYSIGLHGLTDEQCVEIVDRMREDVEIVFKTLKTHVEDRKKYKEAAQRFQQKRSH